jgi:hypothetical protein
MHPQWFFTCDALANYMKIVAKKWDTHDVGTKVEAFAIAGCDPVSKYILLCTHTLIHVFHRPFIIIEEES